jgi:peptidoglycan/xylan/chitin deacetylase (PgdA/CDA1 family)
MHSSLGALNFRLFHKYALFSVCYSPRTFFLVGEMARAYPATARRIFGEGHTIGTHSEDHPSRFGKLPRSLVEWEIDKGVLDVGMALGDHKQVAPFFRVPGLAHSDVIDDELGAAPFVLPDGRHFEFTPPWGSK